MGPPYTYWYQGEESREISTKTPKPQLSVFLVFTFSFKTVFCLINIFSVIVHRLTYRESF